jgi:hypothetical protein
MLKRDCQRRQRVESVCFANQAARDLLVHSQFTTGRLAKTGSAALSVGSWQDLPFAYSSLTSASSHFLPFALPGQHLNVGQVLMGTIQAGNGGFVRDLGRASCYPYCTFTNATKVRVVPFRLSSSDVLLHLFGLLLRAFDAQVTGAKSSQVQTYVQLASKHLLKSG